MQFLGLGQLSACLELTRFPFYRLQGIANTTALKCMEKSMTEVEAVLDLERNHLCCKSGSSTKRQPGKTGWETNTRVGRTRVYSSEHVKHSAYPCIIIHYCIIVHTSNCKPTFASPCMYMTIWVVLLPCGILSKKPGLLEDEHEPVPVGVNSFMYELACTEAPCWLRHVIPQTTTLRHGKDV